ncbi:MAG: diaminopimelate epimerase, partial [Alphaproteobacteria bacterium]
MNTRAFIKMHGLGNDFVVVDAREVPFALDDGRARALADRRSGVGCDQIVVLEPPRNGRADVFLRFWNSDGGEVDACGNGTRCAASLIMAESGRETIAIETEAGLLGAQAAGPGRVTVDMGRADLAWDQIPLAREQDTLHLELTRDGLRDPVA